MSMEGSSSFGLNSLIPQTYKSKAEAFAKCLQDKLMLLGGLNETENVKKRLSDDLNGNKKPEENFPYDISKFSEDNIFVQHPESLIKRDVQTPENKNIEVPKTNGKLKYIKDRRGYSSDSEESDREDLYKKSANVQDLQNADDGEYYHNGSETSDLVLNSHKQSEILHKRVHELINGNNEKNKEPNRKLVSFSSEDTNDSWHSCDDHDAYDSDDNEEVDYFASQIKGSPKLRSTKLRNRKRGYKDDETWKKSSRSNYSPVIGQDVFADFDTECFSPVEDLEESERLLQINDEDAEPERHLVLLDGMDMENYDVPYRILRESSSANNLEKHFSQNNSEIEPIIFRDSYTRKKEASSPMNLKPPSPDGCCGQLLTPPPSPEVNRDEMLSSGDYVMNMKNREELNGDYEELEEEEEDEIMEDVQEDKTVEKGLMGIVEEEAGDEENGTIVEEMTAEVKKESAINEKVEELCLAVAVCEGTFIENAKESIKNEIVNGETETEDNTSLQTAKEPTQVEKATAEIDADQRLLTEVTEEEAKIEETSLEVSVNEKSILENTLDNVKTEIVNGKIETDEKLSLETTKELMRDEEAIAEIDENQRLPKKVTEEEEKIEETNPEVLVNEQTILENTLESIISEIVIKELETDDNTSLEAAEEPMKVEEATSEMDENLKLLTKVTEEEAKIEETSPEHEGKSTESIDSCEAAIKTEVNADINFADEITEPSVDQTDQIQEIETTPPQNFCSTFTKKGGMILECPCDNIKLPILELFAPEESQSTCSIEVQIDPGEESNKEQIFSPVEESSTESGNALTVPNNKSEDDDGEEMLSPRLKLRRCSSLKTWKTPPGTPGRKKIVRFADALGLDLADVRTFLDEIPKIPSSAYEDLNFDLNSDPFSSCHCPAPPPPTMPTLIPMFPQPGGQMDFLERVKTLNISLESAVLTDTTVLTISGIIRVRNLDYNKSVHVRYTLDNWVTISDLQATYVPNSCDGFSDKFSFVLYGHTLKIGQTLEFALRLECLGCQYWDNNSGKNYVFQCLPQSPSTAVYTPLSSSPAESWTSKFY